MKKIKNLWLFVSILVLVVTASVFSVDVTQTTDTRFLFMTGGSEKSTLNLWEIVAGRVQTFSWKIVNNSSKPVDVYLSFVDGELDESWEFLWCKNEWDIEKFAKYVEVTNISGFKIWDKITIPWNSQKDINLKFRLPWATSLSGKYVWCITHSATWASDTGCNFALLSRKANLINMVVKESLDDKSPYIVSVWWKFGEPPINLWNMEIWDHITIIFSEDIEKTSVTGNLFLSPSKPLTFAWTWDNAIIIYLTEWRFAYDTPYTLTIWTWIEDLYGNNLESPFSFGFTVNAPSGNQWTGSSNTGWQSGGNWWWGWGWWGWGWWWGFIDKPQKDNCPDGDFSDSYYDWDCGEYKEAEEDWNHGSAWDWDRQCSIVDSEYSDELNQAYVYACNIGITTMPTIQQANMMWPLLRKHLAKMISEFAVKVLWIEPNKNKVCVFDDMDEETQEMKYFAQVSCQLWLMGLHSDWVTVKDNFDPNEPVTRAQFGTVLSRLLWWTAYATDDWEHFWVNHLEALKNNRIMTQIYGDWPYNIELRWWVMLMLMRVNENNLVSHYSASTWYDESLQWALALIDDGNMNVSIENFENWIMYSSLDFIPIKWEINSSQPVESIYVRHTDSKWKWVYYDYKLEKFKPQDHNFVFYAYRYYNSLTVNDKNTYEFSFYDKNNKLLFKKTVVIKQSYSKNWD